MTDIPCPICQHPTRDGLACAVCAHAIRKDLNALPGWMRELDTQLTRQGQTGSGNGGRGAEQPLVYDTRSSENRDIIIDTIGRWVHTIQTTYQDTTSPGTTITTWCAWLTTRIHRIRAHPDVHPLADELRHCIHLAIQSVDLPQLRLPCGPCPTCGKPVTAPVGAEQGICRHCAWAGIESTVEADHTLPSVLTRAREALVTRKQLLDAAKLYQVQINASTLRTWVQRGTLVEREVTPDGQRLYRVGDVLDLAARHLAETIIA